MATAATLGPGDHSWSFEGRRLDVHVPSSDSAATAMPLVVYLHHLGGDGRDGEEFFALRTLSDQRGYLYAVPRSLATDGQPAWNATDGCCEASETTDDSAYLARVLAELRARLRVDERRVYLIGHSNGGFMAYRMACDHGAQLAAIASIAGAMWTDPARCQPTAPVSVLQVHGTADRTIRFEGGVFRGRVHPPAQLAMSSWSSFNRCGGPARTGAVVALPSPDAPDARAEVTTYASCEGGTEVALWALPGAGHFPVYGPAPSAAILDWLWAHPRR